MAITRAKKEEIMKTLADKFEKSSTAVFTGYKGIDVKSMDKARQILREEGIEYQIAKKTLIKLAIKNTYNFDLSDDLIAGPVGVAFGYKDSVSLCKTLAKISEDLEQFQLLGGIVDDESVDKDMVMTLSKMLSRDELYAKFVGIIKSPLQNFSGLLSGGLSSFATAMKAYADQKEEAK